MVEESVGLTLGFGVSPAIAEPAGGQRVARGAV